MGAKVRSAASTLARTQQLLRALEEKPFDFDFFQTLRHLECLFVDKPRIGQALRPADEALRLAQEPSLAFAPATLSSFEPSTGRFPARLQVRFFGLLGPNGPLPLHLTEYARERLLHGGDRTFPRFLDVIHHRFLALFYRAWAQAQATVSLDRPDDQRFAVYVGSLFGVGASRVRNRDEVSDFAKLFFSGLLVRHARNSDGLAALLSSYFRVAARIEQFVGHWMALPRAQQTRLGADDASAALGLGTVVGARVWDRQHKIRIWLGPLNLNRYESLLPGGAALAKLVAWIRQYLCFELEWDTRLVLAHDEVPQLRLGKMGRLGWTTWLGNFTREGDAQDLILDAERLMNPGNTAFRATTDNLRTI